MKQGVVVKKSETAVLALCLGLVLLVWGVFGQTGRFEFVNYDDKGYVYENSAVRQGVTLQSLREIWTSPQLSNWHPITSLTHLLDVEFFGLDAGRHHRTNVGLHAAAAVLLFLALRRLTGSLWRSALVAALFAVHPLRAESVAWVSGRKDVLSGIFFALTLWAYAEYARRPFSVGRYAVVALFFALGLMSKPTLVPLPFLLWLLDYWPLERFQGSERRRVIVEKLPLLALSVVFCALLLMLQKQEVMAASERVGLIGKVANAVVAYVVYLRQLIWPTGLTVLYPHPWSAVSVHQSCGAAILLALISAVVVLGARRRPFLAVGWLWFLGMLVPVIGLVQVGIQAHADRYTYLPLTGLFLMLVWMIPARLVERRAGRIALSASAAALLLALSAAAYQQTGFWRDSVILWDRAIACSDRNFTAHGCLSSVLAERGRFEEALQQGLRAVELEPQSADAHANLGNLYLRQKNYAEAIPWFEKAMERAPGVAKIYNNLGLALFGAGRSAEAIGRLQQAVEISPEFAKYHASLGGVLLAAGRPEAAVTSLEKALRMDPEQSDVLLNLGSAWMAMRRYYEALSCFDRVLAQRPNSLEALNGKGDVFLRQRNYSAAVLCYEQAAEAAPGSSANPSGLLARSRLEDQRGVLQQCAEAVASAPDSLQVRLRVGGLLAHSGRYRDAVEQFESALQLQPDCSDACNNLAWILATCPDEMVRDGERAVRWAEKAIELHGKDSPELLDTLAAAHAASGDFSNAVETIRRAVQPSAGADLGAGLRERQQLYEAGRMYVEE